MARFVLALVAAAWMTSPASGAELLPLKDAIRREVDASYPFVRCAGLYAAVLGWGDGGKQFDAEVRDKLEAATADLLAAAVAARVQEHSQPVYEATEITLREAMDIGKVYQARFRENYAKTGWVLLADPLTKSDWDFCLKLSGG